MEIKEELENYNDYKSDIKRIDRDIAKLKLEEVTISGSNFEVNGDINCFNGIETIYKNNVKIYELRCNGGLIK